MIKGVFFFLCLIIGVFAEAPLDSIARAAIIAQGHDVQSLGLVIRRVRDNQDMVAINADTQMIPASVQKLFTGAAAFDRLGVCYRFLTQFYVEDFDPLTGIVGGDLWIKGRGDPGITAEKLWLVAQQLRHAGVRAIPHTLRIDNTFFDAQTVGPGYGSVANSRAYMAPVSPLSVSFNAAGIIVRPTNPVKPAEVQTMPPRENTPFEGKIVTTAKGRSFSAVTQKSPSSGMVIKLDGTIGAGQAERYVYRQVWNPAINAGECFRAVAKQVGIDAPYAIALDTLDTTRVKLIHSFESEPLSAQIRGLFKYSNNFMSEMVFRTLGAEMNATQGSWNVGAQTVLDWWNEVLPSSGEITVINGSGMGSGNRCSSRQIADLLQYTTTRPWQHEFIAALPIASVDGTLKSRFKKHSLAGNLRGKTGTLNDLGVSSLAGYFTTEDETYAFVFLINDRKTEQYAKWVLQEKVLEALLPHL